jgi:hypothetical protein
VHETGLSTITRDDVVPGLTVPGGRGLGRLWEADGVLPGADAMQSADSHEEFVAASIRRSEVVRLDIMLPWSHDLAGRLHHETIDSVLLRGNPLGDRRRSPRRGRQPTATSSPAGTQPRSCSDRHRWQSPPYSPDRGFMLRRGRFGR